MVLLFLKWDAKMEKRGLKCNFHPKIAENEELPVFGGVVSGLLRLHAKKTGKKS
jgi:hypothetical protein